MRTRASNDMIAATLVAGTEVVLIGLDVAPEHRAGLLGFSIWKRPAAGGDFKPLIGGRRFRNTVIPAQGGIPLSEAPVQDFLWGDYVVDRNTDYVYRIAAAYGAPGAIEHRGELEIQIRTENPDDGRHGIYFNRGVAASQSYSRRFGAHTRFYRGEEFGRAVWQPFVRPELVPDREAYKWLSRGLGEAMVAFIRKATHVENADAGADGAAATPRYSLKAAVYELTDIPTICAFIDVLDSGADVKIVHHAVTEVQRVLRRNNEASTSVTYRDGSRDPVDFRNSEILEERSLDGIASAAVRSVAAVGVRHEKSQRAFEEMLIPRAKTKIQHNKFIVLLDEGRPVEVWTGSTNLTAGGIYGQSNVGHVIRDPEVAQQYLDYWQQLARDPAKKAPPGALQETGFADWIVLQQPDPVGPVAPNSTSVIFSPRPTGKVLDWYAEQFAGAQRSVHFTTAFTVAAPFLAAATQPPPENALRYLLMESIGGRLREPYQRMEPIAGNRIAWGDRLGQLPETAEGTPGMLLSEALSGLNDHVNYLHTKYMLVDPLGADPLVVTGSANFSAPSTTDNDENMLICRGDLRLADIFLSEFMRLFRHFESRNRRNMLPPADLAEFEFLKEDEHWSDAAFEDGNPAFRERMLFAEAQV